METGKRHNHAPVGTKVDPFVPRSEHSPRELRSWAKRTGFVSDYSGEAGSSASVKFESSERNLHQSGQGSSPKIDIDPFLGRTRPNRGNEIEPASQGGATRRENGTVLDGAAMERGRDGNEPVLAMAPNGDKKVGLRGNGNGVVNRDSNGHGISAVAPVPDQKEEEGGAQGDVKVNLYQEGEVPADEGWHGPSGLKCGLKENPGFG